MCHRVRAGGRGGAGPGSGAFSVARTLRRRTSSPAEATRADEARRRSLQLLEPTHGCAESQGESRGKRATGSACLVTPYSQLRGGCELGLLKTRVCEALGSFAADDYGRRTRPE